MFTCTPAYVFCESVQVELWTLMEVCVHVHLCMSAGVHVYMLVCVICVHVCIYTDLNSISFSCIDAVTCLRRSAFFSLNEK